MTDVNTNILDLSIRHAVGIQRLSSGVVRRLIPILNQADADIVAQLLKRGATLEGSFTSQRLKYLLTAIREINRDAHVSLGRDLRKELRDLAKYEAGFQADMLRRTIPIAVDIVTPSAELLNAVVTSKPFEGRLLREWVSGLERGRMERLRDTIRLGMVQGETSEQIVRRVRGTRALNYRDGVMEIGRRGARAMVQTATNHVSNASRQELYKANEDIISKVQWVSAMDTRVCVQCASLDSRTFAMDSGPRPPAHINCLPGNALVSSRYRVAAVSKHRYDGELVVIRTASGNELACTPNHPVLTDRGWVAAHLLDVGDNVIRDVGPQTGLAGVDPDHEDVPTRIEEVAEAAFGSREMVTRPVPTTAEDFHGDGMDGDVAIIATDRLLADGRESSFPQQGGESLLVGRDMGLPALARPRGLSPMFLAMRAAASRVMCGLDLVAARVFGHVGPFHRLGFALASAGNASVSQYAVDGGGRDAVPVGKRLGGHALVVKVRDLLLRHRHSASVLGLDAMPPEDAGDHLVRNVELPGYSGNAGAGVVGLGHGGCVEPVTRQEGDAVLFEDDGDRVGRDLKGFGKGSAAIASMVAGNDLRCDRCAPQAHLFQPTANADAAPLQSRADRIIAGSDLFADRVYADAFAVKPHGALFIESGAPAGVDPGLLEPVIEGGDVDADLARKIGEGLFGEVAPDKIVSVDRRNFAGHVYNLETEKSFYVANGIITHNCRCTTIPITKSWKELGIDAEELPPGTRATMGGQVSASMSFSDWLKKQPASVQDEALGPSRGKLFRSGGISIDKFVDVRGQELTLEQLKAKDAAAFAKSGLAA